MKMNKTILLLVSVFFCILVTQSCGIPVMFSIVSSITAGSDNIASVSGKYSVSSDVNDNLDLVKTGTGPSLMMFYTIDQSSVVSTTIINRITNAFDTQYRKNGLGIVVPKNKIPVLTITYEDQEYNLFSFSDTTGSFAFSSPKYMLSADNPKQNDLQFSLNPTRIGTTSQYTFDISIDSSQSDSYSSHIVGNSLVRYNGQNFETNSTAIISSNMLDYSNAMDSTAEYQYHIFAAMCVSEGSFNNTYWTPLKYLGYITLPSDNT